MCSQRRLCSADQGSKGAQDAFRFVSFGYTHGRVVRVLNAVFLLFYLQRTRVKKRPPRKLLDFFIGVGGNGGSRFLSFACSCRIRPFFVSAVEVVSWKDCGKVVVLLNFQAVLLSWALCGRVFFWV